MGVGFVCRADDLKNFVVGFTAHEIRESRWKFGEDGLTSKAVDPGNVSLVTAKIDRADFESFEFDGETLIGVDLGRLADMLKVLKKDDVVEFHASGEKLNLRSGSLNYTTNLIDLETIRKEPKVPDLDLNAEITLEPQQFRRAVEVCGKISDSILLRAEKDGFYVEAEGDIDKAVFEFPADELIDFNRAQAKSYFSIELLKQIKFSGNELFIKLGTDVPGIFELNHDRVSISHLIAPRIEVE